VVQCAGRQQGNIRGIIRLMTSTASTTAPNSSVIEKIKKLLALADGNQNEHEREVAMQFAMDLLAKHNLSMSLLEGTADVSICEVEGDFRNDPWIRHVLLAACKLYYTELYISKRFDPIRWQTRAVPVFVGTAENIAVSMDVASWLLNSIRKESNRLYKDEYERRSFRSGAAIRILDRAHEMVEKEKRAGETTTGTGLVVLRNQLERANQDHLAKLNLRHRRSRRSCVDIDAYTSGEDYGGRVRLNRRAAGEQSIARLPLYK